MKTIWNVDNKLVVATGLANLGAEGDLGFEGHAMKGTMYFQWFAIPRPHGYEIQIETTSHRIHCKKDTATFNLGLEIASAL